MLFRNVGPHRSCHRQACDRPVSNGQEGKDPLRASGEWTGELSRDSHRKSPQEENRDGDGFIHWLGVEIEIVGVQCRDEYFCVVIVSRPRMYSIRQWLLPTTIATDQLFDEATAPTVLENHRSAVLLTPSISPLRQCNHHRREVTTLFREDILLSVWVLGVRLQFHQTRGDELAQARKENVRRNLKIR